MSVEIKTEYIIMLSLIYFKIQFPDSIIPVQ